MIAGPDDGEVFAGGMQGSTLLSRQDSRHLPLGEALNQWQENAGSLYDIHLRDRETFFNTGSTFHFGDLLLIHCRSVAQKLSRSGYRIGADGYDHYQVQLYLAGHWSRQDGRMEAQAGPGDLVFHDAAQPHAGAATDFDNLTLFIPRQLLAPLLNRPDEHNMRVITAHEPLGHLLRSHIQDLFRALPLLQEPQAATFVRPTVELAAATLNGAPREETRSGIVSAQSREIRHYIDRHALDPDLSPARIAGLCGISLRKLAYLFEEEGGVAHYIQSQRLYLARQALRDPSQAHKSVAGISLEHGFLHAQNFTRAFQRAFGMTPRETRAMAQKNPGTGAHGTLSWIEQVSRQKA